MTVTCGRALWSTLQSVFVRACSTHTPIASFTLAANPLDDHQVDSAKDYMMESAPLDRSPGAGHSLGRTPPDPPREATFPFGVIANRWVCRSYLRNQSN